MSCEKVCKPSHEGCQERVARVCGILSEAPPTGERSTSDSISVRRRLDNRLQHSRPSRVRNPTREQAPGPTCKPEHIPSPDPHYQHSRPYTRSHTPYTAPRHTSFHAMRGSLYLLPLWLQQLYAHTNGVFVRTNHAGGSTSEKCRPLVGSLWTPRP